MSEAKTEDLWNSYRDLYSLVNKYLTNELPATTYIEFENVLRRNKQCFMSLLHNLPKNSKSRDELKKGMEDGISVKGIGHQILSKELYQEVVIISDMFDLNEYIALDLLCTAQIQMPFFPGLPRGLVAVTLYYEGRKSLVSTLKMLIQARTGVSWSIKIPMSTQKFIDAFTSELLQNGLFTKIFELLNSLDLTKELELLQSNLALGGAKHRRDVVDSFNSIKVTLAECVFLWAAQSGLNKQTTLLLIKHLSEVKLEEEASGKLDDVSLFLIMALLDAVDLSVLHLREDGEDLVQRLPVLSEGDYISAVLNELAPNKNKWACEGLQALAMFGFAVCLSSLRLVPQGQSLQNLIDYEDEFVDAAIILKVFEFMAHVMMENELVYSEQMIYKRLHYLICDFIVQMYPKVKELRIKADETARTIQAYFHEGLELPGSLGRYFENLLLVISRLYSKDPLKMQLMLDFWCPADSSQYRSHPRSVSLFKFIQLAGDMLPPSLFVNYIKMLASLSGCKQAARNCFNMLRQTTCLNNNLSWDHFFMSFNQYYSNLKQEVATGNETVYRHSRLYHKGITPQEIDGLNSVLLLIKSISDHDEFSRLALCEHPGWAPLKVLLGLVSCSIPIPLKADLLLAIASLCKSPEIAAQLWNNLESSQILVTIPTTSSYQPRGIQTELDEVEARSEQYPLTRAFLSLLDALTDHGIPRTLGAGPRQPGFDPYLTFMLQSVFLKFNARSYKEVREKWQVASICLKLFNKFLQQFEPHVTDFPNHNKTGEFNSPPGFHLMIQLHSKSELFNALLFIINEGNRLYDLCITFPEEKHLNTCTLFAMKIIERCLELQYKFFQLLSTSNCPVLLINMSKLLLTINPRTGRPDHVLNIMKYLGYQAITPKQSLVAVRIITLLTTSPAVHAQIINILLSSNDVDTLIRIGFVQCLDQTADEDDMLIVHTKMAIFKLLHQCLPYNAPNLTHFLFGFDLHKNVAKTVFQLPGILNFPRTCIHSLLTGLRQAVYGNSDAEPSLIETSYQMLYSLCSNGKTAEPVLRLVRTQPNFFKDNINYCHKNYNKGIHELNQLGWILKTVAIELRSAYCNKQIVYVKQLTQLLVGLPLELKVQSDSFSMVQKTVEMASDDVAVEQLKHYNFLVHLITEFDFNIPEVVVPQWGFFEHSSLETYLASCQTGGSPKLIDVKRLHKNLLEEVTTVQGSGALGQRQAIIDEIQKVLLHALNINNSRRTTASIVKFVDAWRQVCEVLIIYLRTEVLPAKEQVLLELYLLENILRKAVKSSLHQEVAIYLSGTVLILLEYLRRSHINEDRHSRTIYKENDRKSDRSIIELNTNTMKNILNLIVEWITTSDHSSQKIRINLYGALATFLQLINLTEDSADSHVNDSLYVSRLDNSKYRIQDEISTIYISSNIFSSFGEKLIEILCYDATGGQEICKMLAMSCFSLLIALSGNINWISYISSRGYLKHIIDSILKSDHDLRAVLEPIPDSIKSIYLYDAKMSFLSRLASTKMGSELLLEHRLLSVLANMKVFNFHPELSKHLQVTETSFPSSVETRYLQIWEPALHLCNALLTSMGTDHKEAVGQIMNLILSHLDIVELVLRSGSTSLSLQSLKEISLLTCVIARTANNDLVCALEANQSVTESRSHLHRIQKLMLTLIPRYVLHDNTVRELLCDPNNDHTSYQTSARLSFAIEITANLLQYSRNLIQNHGIDHDSVGVIFQPNLTDTIMGLNGNQKYKSYIDHAPSLGVIVQNLINTVTYYHKEKGTLNFLSRKMSEIPNLGTVDLKDFVVNPAVDISTMREDALEHITQKHTMKKHNIDHCMLIIEHSMYVIWAHLDYYMFKAIPKARNFGLHTANTTFNLDCTLASASEAMWKITTDDISNLKQGLVSIFNDSFCRQLIETSQGRSESDVGFLEVLLRKIKRLIQFVPVK